MNTAQRFGLAILATFTLVTPSTVAAQAGGAGVDKLGTVAWCKDATTVCWSDSKTQRAFSGLRFVFEPQLGVLIQNGDNKFDNTNFRSLEKIGLATNLVGRWVGLQTLFIYPSSIQFDEQSPVRVAQQLTDKSEGKVDVEWGMTFGATALDGVLSIGFGFLRYDRRDFLPEAAADKSVTRDSFFYFNVQAVEAIKGAIKAIGR